MTVTESAAKEIIKIMLRDELSPETHAIRMGVKGGGCSGMTYTLEFDDIQRKFDLAYFSNGLNILVDKKSNLYIFLIFVNKKYDIIVQRKITQTLIPGLENTVNLFGIFLWRYFPRITLDLPGESDMFKAFL